jgi:hypothetical protein
MATRMGHQRHCPYLLLIDTWENPEDSDGEWAVEQILAEAQYQRHHGKDVVVRPSRVGTGKGLYAARDLQAGWELFYCGRYYATWAHLVAAGRNTGQYTIAEGRNEPHFDGEHVPYNLAKYANHRPKHQANAMLGYEPNYGAVGQPTLTIKEQGVAASEEITVDYGPRYAYNTASTGMPQHRRRRRRRRRQQQRRHPADHRRGYSEHGGSDGAAGSTDPAPPGQLKVSGSGSGDEGNGGGGTTWAMPGDGAHATGANVFTFHRPPPRRCHRRTGLHERAATPVAPPSPLHRAQGDQACSTTGPRRIGAAPPSTAGHRPATGPSQCWAPATDPERADAAAAVTTAAAAKSARRRQTPPPQQPQR